MRISSFLAAALLTPALAAAAPAPAPQPLVVHTWVNLLPVAETGGKVLEKGGKALDAVEQAIRLAESDPRNTSVGRGGLPDRDGHLTLDASIMDGTDRAGSVVFLEDIEHPISVARLVMEKTPHVMLAGEGAQQFALAQGMKTEKLLTPGARKAWEQWKEQQKAKERNHDTIGLLALSADGDLAGGCSTSGLAWKLHGRVGDSPLIGAGLYVDDEVGAATATGVGEAVIKTAGSFLVVEQMRQGKTPQEAVEAVVKRIYDKEPRYRDDKDFFVGFLAINKKGDIGAYGYRPVGYKYQVYRGGKTETVDVPSLLP
jgi:N4-(beta-N-acetylglucosaminyl)-L-asparaginase